MSAVVDVDSRPSRAVRSPSTPSQPRVMARYDAAQTTPDNARYWANADSLGPISANNPAVRQILRDRSRYEILNNSRGFGICDTLRNDTIGTGPQLQAMTDDEDMNSLIERRFKQWMEAIDLPEKMRLGRFNKIVDGEAFFIQMLNPVLDTPVRLDVRLIEAEMVTDIEGTFTGSGEVDGIDFDEFGNPDVYWIRSEHPGDGVTMQAEPVSAAFVYHLFKRNRPGQWRGIPEITAALPLFADARRFRDAVIAAAQQAAYYSGILFTDSPQVQPAEVDANLIWELEKRSLLTMPEGWRMSQVEAEQPVTTYTDFMKEIVAEMARCLNMPYNIAAGDSSDYNYASGRLDHQTYFKSITVERSYWVNALLNPLFDAWRAFAELVPGYLPAELQGQMIPRQWFFDPFPHADPQREATAAIELRNNKMLTDSEWFASQKKDWRVQYQQLAREKALREELGIRDPTIPTTMNVNEVVDSEGNTVSPDEDESDAAE